MRIPTPIRSLATALLLVTHPAVARAAQLVGHIELAAQGEALRSDEVRHAVVYFKPSTPVEVQPLPRPSEISMRRKEFVPRVAAVTVGSTVRFPNFDPILHNVFSVSGANAFDLGLYPEGEGKAATFRSPGLVRVFCNVHHDMVAYILVLDTPYFASPAADGTFILADLPEKDGLFVVWHERAAPWSRELRPSASDTLDVRLEVSKPLVPLHPDKNGKPYANATTGKDYR
ncbi:MAG TPA: hypothetical protein VFE28_10965 [Candidatus Krumholzibacteria bacterium]|nr:hypothetical protein [Candidatus Krumholzibacteria bacterium]